MFTKKKGEKEETIATEVDKFYEEADKGIRDYRREHMGHKEPTTCETMIHTNVGPFLTAAMMRLEGELAEGGRRDDKPAEKETV